jgi:hypothetical protein
MNSISAEQAGDAAEMEGGPMWGRFFDSIGNDDNDSALSGSHPADLHPVHSLPGVVESPGSEVHPNDSASVVHDEEAPSALEGFIKRTGHSVLTGAPSSAPADDGTYVFKFRTPSGRTHRFQARHDDVENLRDIVSGKLSTDPFFTEFQPSDEDVPKPDPMDFQLSYTDADGDSVVITSDHDVSDAVRIARKARTDRVVLFIQGGRGWAEAGADKSEMKAAEVTAAAQLEIKEVETAEAAVPEGAASTQPSHINIPQQDEIMGIPKDLLLPASIGALAVVIIGIFIISRLTAERY